MTPSCSKSWQRAARMPSVRLPGLGKGLGFRLWKLLTARVPFEDLRPAVYIRDGRSFLDACTRSSPRPPISVSATFPTSPISYGCANDHRISTMLCLVAPTSRIKTFITDTIIYQRRECGSIRISRSESGFDEHCRLMSYGGCRPKGVGYQVQVCGFGLRMLQLHYGIKTKCQNAGSCKQQLHLRLSDFPNISTLRM